MTTTNAAGILVLVAAIQSVMSDGVAPDPKVFFPKIEGNLTKIRWAHAVNSQAELEKALASGDVMMLEADVVIGKLNSTDNATDVPIMAHPPANTSDLTLEDFLAGAVQNATKGVKLDFKSIEAFEKSAPILKRYRGNLTIPVFLNADILAGPVAATAMPVDAKKFLSGAAATLPESVLSVGWTTRYDVEQNATEGRYTPEHVRKMIDVLTESKVTQPVTYPVRAVFAASDANAVKTLLANSTFANATLTVWSAKGDNVDADKLSELIKSVGVDKVYVDVPDDVWSKLRISAAPTVGSTILTTLAAATVAMLFSRML